MCRGSSEAKYLGTGTLARKNARSVKDIFIFINIHLKAEKAGVPEGGRAYQQRKKEQKAADREPWLIFSNTAVSVQPEPSGQNLTN